MPKGAILARHLLVVGRSLLERPRPEIYHAQLPLREHSDFCGKCQLQNSLGTVTYTSEIFKILPGFNF